ncbi:MAG: CDC27 family protein [Campylobacterota bacterium]|nr:CDC27 family protein [Campylobacterota bacterium]
MKSLLVFLFFVTFSFSLDVDKYKEAKELFNNGNYEESAEILNKILNDDISNIEINFYLGRSYFEMGDYENAMVHFDRILIIDENQLRARVELAQTYLKLNLKEDALTNFNHVLKQNIPDNVRQNIYKILNLEKKTKKNSFFYGSVSLGLTKDTNVNNTTFNKTYDTPVLTDIKVTDDEIKDNYSDASLRLNHNYNINEKYSIENKINLTDQRYENETTNNMQLLTYNLNLVTKTSNLKIYYGLDYLRTTLDSEDYLNIVGYSVNLQKNYSNHIRYFSSIKVSKKSYSKDENKNLNSNNYQVIIGSNITVSKISKFNLMYIYSKDIKDDKEISDETTNAIIIGNSYSIYDNLKVNSSIFAKYKKDSLEFTEFEVNKKDELYITSIGLDYYITKSFILSTNFKNSRSLSNIPIYAYTKKTYGISITKRF